VALVFKHHVPNTIIAIFFVKSGISSMKSGWYEKTVAGAHGRDQRCNQENSTKYAFCCV